MIKKKKVSRAHFRHGAYLIGLCLFEYWFGHWLKPFIHPWRLQICLAERVRGKGRWENEFLHALLFLYLFACYRMKIMALPLQGFLERSNEITFVKMFCKCNERVCQAVLFFLFCLILQNKGRKNLKAEVLLGGRFVFPMVLLGKSKSSFSLNE